MSKTCSVDQCDRAARARGYCGMHYKRVQTHGDPLADRPRYGRMDRCQVEGCAYDVKYRGYCGRHLRRLREYGDPLAGKSLNRPAGSPAKPCTECSNPAIAHGLCHNHYRRLKLYGDPKVRKDGVPEWRLDLQHPEAAPWRTDKNGYKWVYWPEHPCSSVRGMIYEHTAVMSNVLERELQRGETVHHRNGITGDNRPKNLELWASRHPGGQRVTDLVAFAHEILDQYGDEVDRLP